jgi:hypothetical protein
LIGGSNPPRTTIRKIEGDPRGDLPRKKEALAQKDIVCWIKIQFSNSKVPIFDLLNVLKEAKPAFSVFSSGLSLSVVFYAALNLQLSFLFLTKCIHLSRQ